MKDTFKNSWQLLSQVKSPEDLKKIDNLELLCEEIRQKLIQVVSENGGHLSSNLGVVELTVAIHKIFDLPEDKIVWDVGHQCYAHKMLTGRLDKIGTIRKEGGLSGFTNRSESEYDIFTSGHSSTSISAAVGLARAKKINGESGSVVAVIGDGALTGGLAYEGLNNAQKLKNFILILNDNHMSISKNVGAVARYLTAARMGATYRKAKNALSGVLEKTAFGMKIEKFLKSSKSAVKNIVYKSSIFEKMGFEYYGPVDGHNLKELENAFKIAKHINKPVVIHVVTSKGKGYSFAQKDPKNFHGVSPFNILTGDLKKKKSANFSEVFGNKICELAKDNPKICAVTAAMTGGTGLAKFKEKFKSRFFDVGIAEAHAVTFSAGLCAGGLTPVFAVYSSFLQRAYDEIIHDASMQNLKVILAVDRAGFVGEDGEAHQGLFDVSFLNTVPNARIFAPSFFSELEEMMDEIVSCESNHIEVLRYPRGGELFKPENYKYNHLPFEFFGDLNSKVLIVTYGRLFSNAFKAMKNLEKQGKKVCILKLNIIKPIDEKAVLKCLDFENILVFEESCKSGAVGEKLGSLIAGKFNGNFEINAVPDTFVAHASVDSQMKKYGLDQESMENKILKLFN